MFVLVVLFLSHMLRPLAPSHELEKIVKRLRPSHLISESMSAEKGIVHSDTSISLNSAVSSGYGSGVPSPELEEEVEEIYDNFNSLREGDDSVYDDVRSSRRVLYENLIGGRGRGVEADTRENDYENIKSEHVRGKVDNLGDREVQEDEGIDEEEVYEDMSGSESVVSEEGDKHSVESDEENIYEELDDLESLRSHPVSPSDSYRELATRERGYIKRPLPLLPWEEGYEPQEYLLPIEEQEKEWEPVPPRRASRIKMEDDNWGYRLSVKNRERENASDSLRRSSSQRDSEGVRFFENHSRKIIMEMMIERKKEEALSIKLRERAEFMRSSEKQIEARLRREREEREVRLLELDMKNRLREKSKRQKRVREAEKKMKLKEWAEREKKEQMDRKREAEKRAKREKQLKKEQKRIRKEEEKVAKENKKLKSQINERLRLLERKREIEGELAKMEERGQKSRASIKISTKGAVIEKEKGEFKREEAEIKEKITEIEMELQEEGIDFTNIDDFEVEEDVYEDMSGLESVVIEDRDENIVTDIDAVESEEEEGGDESVVTSIGEVDEEEDYDENMVTSIDEADEEEGYDENVVTGTGDVEKTVVTDIDTFERSAFESKKSERRDILERVEGLSVLYRSSGRLMAPHQEKMVAYSG